MGTAIGDVTEGTPLSLARSTGASKHTSKAFPSSTMYFMASVGNS